MDSTIKPHVTKQASRPPDGTGLIDIDPWLTPYADALRHRYSRYQAKLQEIKQGAGSLEAFSRGYEYFGFNRGVYEGKAGVWYREWAPCAGRLFLTGDFNGWNRNSHPMTRDEFGVWSLFLPDEQYKDALVHGSKIKVCIHSSLGPMDRIPAYIRRVERDEVTNNFTGQYWCPPTPYAWQHPVPKIRGSFRIYEAHVGMSTEEMRIASYREMADWVLPRIANARYNAVQLMAIQEHPYYASFGYHVSNFYAASSRFGTPEDLKYLIDKAHSLGLLVLLDIVHSHCVKNINEGLNQFDGTEYQYFHAGPRGKHPAWDSLLFDYSKWEVLRFLLSNIRFWLDEYRFDGFRFDGVTSMLYYDHGLGKAFTSYDDYFGGNVDQDAVTYLQLAMKVAHDVNPNVIAIAEDVSGMAGMARPVDEGGIGFDCRLAMGVPDYWIKLLKERRDETWSMDELYHTLTNRRSKEKHIAYAESHDQALVGDKTIAFWLMDADMYWKMSKATAGNLVIDRGIALHKMIRLITFALGGEGYLNFMGNEFGHPEWIDFPREGNNFSFQYARRQWHLVDDPLLRYRDLAMFDRELQLLDEKYGLLSQESTELLYIHEDNKLMVFRRGPLVFLFNFHPTQSYSDYWLGAPDPNDYRLILNTDDPWFGGHGIVQTGQIYHWQDVKMHGKPHAMQVYIPARTAQVLEPTGLPLNKAAAAGNITSLPPR